jgi:hypothetical protein
MYSNTAKKIYIAMRQYNTKDKAIPVTGRRDP